VKRGAGAYINSAYGGSWTEGQYGANHNPQTMASVGKLNGIPMLIFYGLTDHLCMPAEALALKAKLGRGFAEERPRLLRQVQDPALLARIHLLEEDWKALDRLLKRASPEAYPALAAVLEERLPQEAARLYLEAAKARVEAGGRAAYREAAGLLGRLARLDPKRAREAAWGLVRAYPRRRALREELAPLLGSPHEPHP